MRASTRFLPARIVNALLALVLTPMLSSVPTFAAETAPVPPAQILQDLRSFNTVATLLHLAAHPDDENTQLITYFARGRGYRTAYLSITRGDGGQNELGPDFDSKLGVLRTQELLAARKLDGGRQFFTRAIDFGYSKSPEETLTFWDKKEVLGDVVRVIRQFRPDVIVTRFPPPPGSGGHGHHTASAMLAIEAFKLAADPTAYPEQLDPVARKSSQELDVQLLAPWQPKRVVWNGNPFSRSGGLDKRPSVKVEIGGTDPVTGELFGAIANRSRGMHKTQGFDVFSNRAPQASVEAVFYHLEGEVAEKDLFDGVDTSWARIPGGEEIGRLTAAAIANFKSDDPAASVPALLEIRKKLRALGASSSREWRTYVSVLDRSAKPQPRDPVLGDKLDQLDDIIRACLGLQVSVTTTAREVVSGEKIPVKLRASIRSSVVPVKVEQVVDQVMWFPDRTLAKDDAWGAETEHAATTAVPLSQPYWLREEPEAGIARVADPTLIGIPDNPPVLPVVLDFNVGGESISVRRAPMFVSDGGREQGVSVVAPVTLTFAAPVQLFASGETKVVTIRAIPARRGMKGVLRLAAGEGWRVEPKQIDVEFGPTGASQEFTFNVTAPRTPSAGQLTAWADVGGRSYSHQRIELNYAHLPPQILQPAAMARVVSMEVAKRGRKVGYLPGAGDATAEALQQLGYEVTVLTAGDVTPEKLRELDAVVVGVRAFTERRDMAALAPVLFAYAEAGGTAIAQYNRPSGGGARAPLGPYPLSLDGPAPQQRVTDEKSPVQFLAPDHPVLTMPNRITAADFEGWVQERGLYFPSKWDEAHYTPVLGFNDPGEAPLTSGVLIAKHGKGYYVYTSLAFFRQLPAGVPGAYRLFANLVSLGKTE